ncbi:MAG: hypothetical protein EBT79_07430 [Actinobacteria bacterium]|nr:hypothetical protein [Actinomycetota bacterium]NBR67091.1 hypothetical protein [Actinomycetota bacterium]
MSDTLRSKIVRLAHANPNLRPHLLPLLKQAAGDELVYGNKDRHGSFFLTAFAFGSTGPEDDKRFLDVLRDEVDATLRKYHMDRFVYPRLDRVEDGVLLVWWGGDNNFSSPDSMDDDDRDSEAYWEFESVMEQAFESTARKMGLPRTRRMNHAADVKAT